MESLIVLASNPLDPWILALALLTTSEPLPDEAAILLLEPSTAHHWHEVNVLLDLADPDSTLYSYHQYTEEPDVVRDFTQQLWDQRGYYLELCDAPGRDQLPYWSHVLSPTTLHEAYNLNCSCTQMTLKYLELYADVPLAFEYWSRVRRENTRLNNIYSALLVLRPDWAYSIISRRRALASLRTLLGEDAFYGMKPLPPPVPLHLLPDIDQ